MQGKICNTLTRNDALEDSGIYSLCLTDKEMWLEDRTRENCDKFSDTLTKEQAAAFRDVMALQSMCGWYGHNRGVAEGLLLARELRSFLDNPAFAMNQAELHLNGAYEANKSEFERLRKYFDEIIEAKAGDNNEA